MKNLSSIPQSVCPGLFPRWSNCPNLSLTPKVRGSYTEVGAPVSRSGLTPGTVTTPIVGGALDPTGIYPFTDFKAERTKSYEFGLSLKLWNKLSAEVTYYHSNTYNQTFLGDLPNLPDTSRFICSIPVMWKIVVGRLH